MVAIARQTAAPSGSLMVRRRGVRRRRWAASIRAGGRVAPGSATRARVRRPLGDSAIASNRTSASGIRSATWTPRSRRRGPDRAGRRRPQPGSGPPLAGRSGPRRARNAARRRSAGSRPGPRSGSADARRASGPLEPVEMARRHDRVLVAVGEQDRPAIAREGSRRAGRSDGVASRSEVDAGREPGERDRRSGRGSADGRGGRSGASAGTGRTDRRSPRSPRRAGRRRRPGSPRSRPSSGRKWRPTVTSGRSIRTRNAAAASSPNSPALSGSTSGGLAPWPRTSKVRQWKPGGVQEDGHRQRPIARRFPAVDEDDARSGRPALGPGRTRPAGRCRPTARRSIRTAGRDRTA